MSTIPAFASHPPNPPRNSPLFGPLLAVSIVIHALAVAGLLHAPPWQSAGGPGSGRSIEVSLMELPATLSAAGEAMTAPLQNGNGERSERGRPTSPGGVDEAATAPLHEERGERSKPEEPGAPTAAVAAEPVPEPEHSAIGPRPPASLALAGKGEGDAGPAVDEPPPSTGPAVSAADEAVTTAPREGGGERDERVLAGASAAPVAAAPVPEPATPARTESTASPTAGHEGPATVNAGSAVRQPARFEGAGLNNPSPRYPYAARQRGQEGRVMLTVRVGRDGRALDVAVAAGSGHRLLDQAAVEAVREWRFEPAREGQDPVEAQLQVPVSFRLR